MKLKVLALTNLFPSAWDPRRAAYNRQQFTRLGGIDEVSVVTAIPWSLRLRRRRGAPACEGIETRSFTFAYPPRVFPAWQPSWWLASLLARQGAWLRRRDFDVLLASWAFPDAVACLRLARRLGKPCVVKVHGSDVNVMAHDPARRPAIVRTLQGADAVVAVSGALADAVVALGVARERVQVIYNGVDTGRFHPGARDEARRRLGVPAQARRILCVGNLKTGKGCLDLVDALPLLLRDQPEATLAFVGDGPDRAALLQRIEARGVTRQVLLSGELGHDELADQYRAADVVCLPSHGEGVPNVLLEAMACGVPVVATDVGGIPEVVPLPAGILVRPRDPAALAAALHEALRRPWDAAAIRAHAEGFRWDDNVAALHGVLAAVVEHGPGGGAR